METMTIGQLAQAVGVNVETVRYYERRGLLPAPDRSPAGYRHYSDDDRGRLEFIKRAQRFGFTLAEIADLLDVSATDARPCDSYRARAEARLRAIDEERDRLDQIRRRLQGLIAACAAGDDDCLTLGGDT